MLIISSISWFWILIAVVAFFALMFIMRWLKAQKEKDNIFLRDYVRTKRLCGIQANRKRIKERPIWFYILVVSIFLSVLFFVIALVLNDVPAFSLAIGVFIFGLAASIFLKVTKFLAQYDIVEIIGNFGVKIVGYYMGESITSDGYKNYLIWDSRKFVFWKNTFILKVNLNEKVKIETYNQESKKREVNVYDLPKNLITEGENVIAIKGEGFDVAGYYYYPVMTDAKGNIINMDLIAFARAREVAMLDTLYQQTEDFAKIQRETININPTVRYVVKTKGESMSDTNSES
jgi:hypothetical protein